MRPTPQETPVWRYGGKPAVESCQAVIMSTSASQDSRLSASDAWRGSFPRTRSLGRPASLEVTASSLRRGRCCRGAKEARGATRSTDSMIGRTAPAAIQILHGPVFSLPPRSQDSEEVLVANKARQLTKQKLTTTPRTHHEVSTATPTRHHHHHRAARQDTDFLFRHWPRCRKHYW